jgi:hypothetical protein
MPANVVRMRRTTQNPDRMVPFCAHQSLDHPKHQEEYDERQSGHTEGRHLIVGGIITERLQPYLNPLDEWFDRRLELLPCHVRLDRQNGRLAHEGR